MHHLLDLLHSPSGPGSRAGRAQFGCFAGETGSGAEGELCTVGLVLTEGLAFVKGGDFRVFFVGEVVPVIAV